MSFRFLVAFATFGVTVRPNNDGRHRHKIGRVRFVEFLPPTP